MVRRLRGAPFRTRPSIDNMNASTRKKGEAGRTSPPDGANPNAPRSRKGGCGDYDQSAALATCLQYFVNYQHYLYFQNPQKDFYAPDNNTSGRVSAAWGTDLKWR